MESLGELLVFHRKKKYIPLDDAVCMTFSFCIFFKISEVKISGSNLVEPFFVSQITSGEVTWLHPPYCSAGLVLAFSQPCQQAVVSFYFVLMNRWKWLAFHFFDDWPGWQHSLLVLIFLTSIVWSIHLLVGEEPSVFPNSIYGKEKGVQANWSSSLLFYSQTQSGASGHRRINKLLELPQQI